MSYFPKDGVFKFRTMIFEIKAEHGWHPAQLKALLYGFQTGIEVGLAYIEAGYSTYRDEFAEAVKHLKDGATVASVVNEINSLTVKNYAKVDHFWGNGYMSGDYNRHYVDGFDCAYLWVVDVLNAFMSHGLDRSVAAGETKRHILFAKSGAMVD